MYYNARDQGEQKDVVDIGVVDLREYSDLKPVTRTSGTGLPEYKLGWFRVANGAKAFLSVSPDRAVFIKLRDKRYVILIPGDIDEFVDRMKELGWIAGTQST